ncbi:MAG TPA: lamin tail domain-containing protein [Janthinobacterium sp.]|nr:lamin tail domain-containing protein [Janthinobacterium sp.]
MKKLLASIPGHSAGLPCRLSAITALLAGISAPALAASDVVISQIYGGGGNSGSVIKNDFVEVFNRSASAVDVSNWSVQYASAAGASWQVTALPSVVLQPGQYLLVAESKGTGGGIDLPAADASGTIAMSATAGKIALSNAKTALTGANPSGAAVADLVGFGTASGFEGAAGPTPSNTLAILRNEDGCSDSDNNAADFVTGAPAPRNSASEPRVCGTPIMRPIVATCPASVALALGSAGGAALSATAPASPRRRWPASAWPTLSRPPAPAAAPAST